MRLRLDRYWFNIHERCKDIPINAVLAFFFVDQGVVYWASTYQ